MVKESNLVAVTKIPKRIGQRQQVIVMNPDQVVGLQYFVQLRGKTLVDPHIAAEIAAGALNSVPILRLSISSED
jgi:hypothetical protein